MCLLCILDLVLILPIGEEFIYSKQINNLIALMKNLEQK